MPDAPPIHDPARLGNGAGPPGEDAEAAEDARRLAEEPATACLNCGARLPGRFCPDCGQRAQPVRTPLHRFVAQSFAELMGLDSRVWRTLGALVFKPGTLTRAYLSGRRETYARPLRVYLTATVLFFLLLSTIDPVGRAQDTIFRDLNGSDSLTVATLDAELDSTIAAGFDYLADDYAELDSARSRLDSLRVVARAPSQRGLDRDDLLAEIENEAETVADMAEAIPSDSVRHIDWLRRARITRAVLAEYPPDSVVVRDLVEGPANLAIRDSVGLFDPGTDAWLVQSEAARSIAGAPTDAERAAAFVRFLRSAIGYVPSVLFVILPVFALILKVLYVRRDWHFSEHLVFGLHTHAFAFVAFIAMTLVAWAATATDQDGAVNSALGWTFAALAATIPVYFYAAQKRVYAQGWLKTTLKAGLLAIAYFVVLLTGLLLVLGVTVYFG